MNDDEALGQDIRYEIEFLIQPLPENSGRAIRRAYGDYAYVSDAQKAVDRIADEGLWEHEEDTHRHTWTSPYRILAARVQPKTKG